MPNKNHFAKIQEIYVAYYQRPADPAGLLYWAERLEAENGEIAGVIDAFASSRESTTLYGRVDDENVGGVIDRVFQALFGRPADEAGKAFYEAQFASGTLSAGAIALAVLSAAKNDDKVVINNKVSAANEFTQLVAGKPLDDPDFGKDPSSFAFKYEGDQAAVSAREFIAQVTSDPSTVPNPDVIKDALENLGAAPTTPPAQDLFNVTETDGTIEFSGSAKGPITFDLNARGEVVFERGGIVASKAVKDLEDKTISLAGNQVLEVSPKLASHVGEITGAGKVKLAASFGTAELDAEYQPIADELIGDVATAARFHTLKLDLNDSHVVLPNDAETNLLTYGDGVSQGERKLKSLEISLSGHDNSLDLGNGAGQDPIGYYLKDVVVTGEGGGSSWGLSLGTLYFGKEGIKFDSTQYTGGVNLDAFIYAGSSNAYEWSIRFGDNSDTLNLLNTSESGTGNFPKKGSLIDGGEGQDTIRMTEYVYRNWQEVTKTQDAEYYGTVRNFERLEVAGQLSNGAVVDSSLLGNQFSTLFLDSVKEGNVATVNTNGFAGIYLDGLEHRSATGTLRLEGDEETSTKLWLTQGLSEDGGGWSILNLDVQKETLDLVLRGGSYVSETQYIVNIAEGSSVSTLNIGGYNNQNIEIDLTQSSSVDAVNIDNLQFSESLGIHANEEVAYSLSIEGRSTDGMESLPLSIFSGLDEDDKILIDFSSDEEGDEIVWAFAETVLADGSTFEESQLETFVAEMGEYSATWLTHLSDTYLLVKGAWYDGVDASPAGYGEVAAIKLVGYNGFSEEFLTVSGEDLSVALGLTA